ncbi:MAG: EthD domain-containing protein [Janthinobacterium lividum]
MIKHISFIYRPAHMSHAEVVEYWKKVHSQLVKTKLPGLRKYVGNFPVNEPGSGAQQPGSGKQMQCDAVVELHFDDVESLHAAMASPGWLSDERKKSSASMMDFTHHQFVVVEEVVVPLD